jgi:hypothetical protein
MGGEWIKHDGGPCPEEVLDAAREGRSIELQFYEAEGETTKDPKAYCWAHGQSRWDIVAYRIETAAEPQQEPPPEKMGVQWTSHNGGECPDEVVFAYRNRQRVIVLFRDTGRTEILRCFPRCYRWSHSGLPGDIMGYSIETAGEPKQKPQPAKPAQSVVPIFEGWREVEQAECVEQEDLFWDDKRMKWYRVTAWGYRRSATKLLIIRQLPSCYHRGCGSINVGVDR